MSEDGGDRAAPIVSAAQCEVPYYRANPDLEKWPEVRAVLEKCRAFRIDPDRIHQQMIYEEGFTNTAFLKHCRALANHTDADVTSAIVTEAIRRRALPCTYDYYGLKELVLLCKWLKTRDGAETVQKAHRQMKLKKKAGPDLSVRDVALVQALRSQKTELDEWKKQTRAAFDAEMEELRRALRRKEMEKEETLKAGAKVFYPACYYNEPDEESVRKQAYEMYKVRAESQRLLPMARNEHGYNIAMANFGDRIKQVKQVEYAKVAENKKGLIASLKKKILKCQEEEGDVWQELSFRVLLSSIGEPEPDVVLVQTPSEGELGRLLGRTSSPSASRKRPRSVTT